MGLDPEFKSFGKIPKIDKIDISITQKLHGSNGQIYIYKDENDELQVKAGSRNKWLAIGDDNFGFARFVEDNKQMLIEVLGEGRHFGEWCGPGINSGEGLKEKRFFLFNWENHINKILPKQLCCVPILVKKVSSIEELGVVINNARQDLKNNGSRLVPGFLKPEGIVIKIDNKLFKCIFDNEETQWNSNNKIKKEKIYNHANVDYLLQPIRLEKLLSKDESYTRNYPESIGKICKDYIQDLKEENQFKYETEEDLENQLKSLSRCVFHFIKQIINE